MRTTRVLALAGGLAVALAAVAGAQTAPVAVSMAYHPPAGWAPSSVAAGSVFSIRDGDKIHTLIFVTVAPKVATEVEGYAATRIAAEKQRGAEVNDEGVMTACDGEPAHRWSVTSASTGQAIQTHILATTVTGGIATVTYSHRQDVGDRHDALDAMNTLCPGPLPNPVPAGWTSPASARYAMPSRSIESPDGTSTFVTSYRVLAPDRFEAFQREAMPGGTIVTEHQEPCGTGTVRRLDVRVGAQIAEVAVGYVHRIAYRYVYTRPTAHDADPAAERALTAFCRSAPIASPSAAPPA